VCSEFVLVVDIMLNRFPFFRSLAAGRDVIGIAKTGSGKTLAYVLPMLRHILAQPPLDFHESGPIGLILCPARELAFQVHSVCKSFAKQLGLK
jgi:ATP-dependent RNA helicase DDX46/PRP5